MPKGPSPIFTFPNTGNSSKNGGLSASALLAVALLLLSIALGLYLRMETNRHTQVVDPVRNDAAQYTAYAYNLKLHGVYSGNIQTIIAPEQKPAPDALRPPGYPLFLLTFTGTNDLSVFLKNVTLAQAIIGTVTLLLIAVYIYYLLGAWPAFLVTLLCAISPHLITMDVYILSESIFTLLLLLTFIHIQAAYHTNSTIFWTVAALLLAMSALTRPWIQYFIIVLLALVYLHKETGYRTKTIFLVTIAFSLPIVAWMTRNLFATGAFTDDTQLINALHHGMYPGFMYGNDTDSFAYPYNSDPESARISASVRSVLATLAERFGADFTGMVTWYLTKPAYLLQWSMIQGYMDIFVYPVWASPYFLDDGIFPATASVMEWLHPLLTALGIIGVFLVILPGHTIIAGKNRLFGLRVLAALYIYFILVHMAGAPFPRYAIPMRPFTYLFAVYSLLYIVAFLARFPGRSSIADKH